MSDHARLWRVGRKVGRTIYAQVDAEPSDTDRLIGMMDSPILAAEAVKAHNEYRRWLLLNRQGALTEEEAS